MRGRAEPQPHGTGTDTDTDTDTVPDPTCQGFVVELMPTVPKVPKVWVLVAIQSANRSRAVSTDKGTHEAVSLPYLYL